MVYCYISKNLKMLRNILKDYEVSNDLSPYEYMKVYIEKCPNTMEDYKISWIVETFLSFQKHSQFLKEMVSHVSDNISEEDQDFFMIVLNAIIFHITPEDMPQLYKCLFNLSKQLLNIFTTFLSNNEVLTFISQVAHSHYDTNFVTEKIIDPLFTWQPYISEMAHSYAQYVKKTESRRLKPPTVPVQLNVLNRKGKEEHSFTTKPSVPQTPPNSLSHKEKKMLTKSVIDHKLKLIHESNKQRSIDLLKEAKTKGLRYTQGKSDKYHKNIACLRDENENKYTKAPLKIKPKIAIDATTPVVRETAATIKRINKRVKMSEKEEVQWLQDLLNNCKNTVKIEELEEYDRQEKERERLLDIERKHLLGQISYEEAILAKKKLHDTNKKKHEDFVKEKRLWEEQIERWKRSELEKNRRQAEKLSLIELEMLHAKHNVTVKKKENAEKLRKESEELLSNAMNEKQAELDRRIKMIKEIKILTMIAKKAKLPKIIDLTESSGLGFLCEMSIAELQERLSVIKIGLKEELDKKRKEIKEKNLAVKHELEETKKSIKKYMSERSNIRQQNKKTQTSIDVSSIKEIDELKNILEDKRKQRIMLTS